MAAVDANRALLTFPQVTEFDVMFARVIVITATQVLTTILIVAASILLGADFRPNGIVTGLVVLICSPLCALGIGMVCGSLAVFVPVISKLVPMVLRVAFFLSGVFFSVSAFKQDLANYMLLNPILQVSSSCA